MRNITNDDLNDNDDTDQDILVGPGDDRGRESLDRTNNPDAVTICLSHHLLLHSVHKVGGKLHLQRHVSLLGLADPIVRHTEVGATVLPLDAVDLELLTPVDHTPGGQHGVVCPPPLYPGRRGTCGSALQGRLLKLTHYNTAKWTGLINK